MDPEDTKELDGHATALTCAIDALGDASTALRQAERRVQEARSVVRQVAARLVVLAEERHVPPNTLAAFRELRDLLAANDTKGTD